MTILDEARTHLRDLAATLQRSDDPRTKLFESLYDVADHTCRVGDHADDHFYAAGKAKPLVRGAIYTEREAVLTVNADRDNSDEAGNEAIIDQADLLLDLHSALGQRSWQIAQGRPPTVSDIRDWKKAGEAYRRWLTATERLAVPDEQDN